MEVGLDQVKAFAASKELLTSESCPKYFRTSSEVGQATVIHH